MTQNNNDAALRQKMADLDDHLNSLTIMLNNMMNKMDSIELATVQMCDIIKKDMGESRNFTDVE
jgi:hypothetical protein